MTIEKQKAKYLKAVKAYASSQPIMTDTEFDALEMSLRNIDPEFVETHHYQVEGVGRKVKLPVPMPGLKKVTKANPSVPKSFKGTTLIVSPKIDGCSALIRYRDGLPVNWYTRGRNGVGHDISHLIEFANVPVFPSTYSGFIRFEIYVTKSDFAKLQKTTDYKNAQRVATACITSKEPIAELKQLKFAALYAIDKTKTVQQCVDLATTLRGYVPHSRFKCNDVDNSLSKFYASYSELDNVDTDGIVVMDADSKFELSYDTEPDFAFAYKENVEGVHAVVKNVHYKESAFGKLIPVVSIEPTVIDGITITNVTGHNYENIVTKKIGPGAIVSIVRSGDVIPFIEGVIKPAKSGQDPKIEFGRKGVHAVALNKTEGYTAEKILRVAIVLGVEGVGPVNAESLANVCNVKKVHPVSGFLKHRTVFLKYAFSANQLQNVIVPRLSEVSPEQLAVASGCFAEGLGVKRAAKALRGEALGPVFDAVWSEGLESFEKFYQKVTGSSLDQTTKRLQSEEKIVSNGNVVWSGYRDKTQEKQAQSKGFAVSNAVNKETCAVFVNNVENTSTKTQKAAKMGIPVMLFEKWTV